MPRWAPTQEQIDLIASTPVDEICLNRRFSTMSLPTTTMTDAAKTIHRALLYVELGPAHDIVDDVYIAQAGCDAQNLLLETLLWCRHQITGVDPAAGTTLEGYPARTRYLNAA